MSGSPCRRGRILRPYGDTTGDGMVQMSSRCRCRTPRSPRARRPSWPTRWASTRRWWCTPSRWARTSRSSSSTAGCNHLVDADKVEVVERDYPLLTPKEVNAAIKRALRRRLVVVGACIGTDAHTVGIDAILNIKGFAGEKGLEYYREIKVVNLGAQVSVPAARRAGPRREGRRRPGLPGRHPARRAPAQHPEMSAAFRESYPARRGGRCSIVGGPRFDESDGRRARRRPGLQPRHDARRGRAATSSTGSRPAEGRAMSGPDAERVDRQRRRAPASSTAATCRTPTPTTPATWSTAPTASACSATSRPRCASAPTATRACSRRTPTCSSAPRCAPATCSRSRCELVRVGTRVAGAWTSPCTWSRAAPRPRSGPGAASARPAAAGHHGDRHRRRAAG